MDANTQTIYEELKEVARSRQTLFYEDLSKLIDLPPRSRKLYEILDSINLNEYQEGRPLRWYPKTRQLAKRESSS